MYIGVTVIIISIIYTSLVYIIFKSKKTINTTENKFYNILISSNIIGLFLELLCCFFVKYRDFNAVFTIINVIVNRIFLIYFVSWPITFGLYVLYLSYNSRGDKKTFNIKKIKVLVSLMYVISNLLVLTLPLYYFSDKNYTYSYGPACNAIVIVTIFVILASFISLFKNIKYIKANKYFPLFALVVALIIACIIRNINPGIIVINSCFSLITIIMYFTIENPDMKMLDELYKNKSLVEQSYIDKSNFLFEITGEIREPIYKIQNICKDFEDKKIKSNEAISLINNYSRELNFIVNDVLDVNSLDVQKLKLVNTKYNINLLYDEIINKIKPLINSNVEFRSNINKNIPYLYGDNIKIKQVITSILLNSINKTEIGYIELNIDAIEKYDVVRLIITIKDTGSGISIDKINDILSVTGELDANDTKLLEKNELNLKLCQKIIKLMGGSLMIKSGEGTEVIFTINQKVDINIKKDILEKYEHYIKNNKSFVIVSQNKKLNSILKEKFNSSNIDTTVFLNGNDLIDNIKSGKKYDCIFVEDEMKEINGYTTLKKLKEINDFNIPVVVILNDNKLSIKDEYLKDGFYDYLLISNLKEELNRIIDKL